MAFSHDGRRLAAGDADGSLWIWDPLLGKDVLKIKADPNAIEFVAFTADDSAIVTRGQFLRQWGGLSVEVPVPVQRAVDLLPWLRNFAAVPAAKEDGSTREVRLTSADRQALPILVAPAGNYVLRGKFTRTRSGKLKTIGFLLPAGNGKTMLTLDHEDRATSGLDQVEKHGVGNPDDPANPTNCPVQLVDGKSCALEAHVELQGYRAQVTVQVDGREIIRWQGPQQALSMWPGWEVPDSRMMGLALGDVDVTIEQLELTPLDSRTHLLEPLSSKPSPPPGTTVVAAPGTIDLLPLVDPEHGAVDAAVKQSDQGIEITPADKKWGRLILPVWPRGAYEIECAFTAPEDGLSMGIVVPIGESRVSVGPIGLSMVKGISVTKPDNPTRLSENKVKPGQKQRLLVRVSPEGDDVEVRVLLDGEPYYAWKGPRADLRLAECWETPHQHTPLLQCQNVSWTCHELELKMLDGEAWILRPAAHDAAPAAAGH